MKRTSTVFHNNLIESRRKLESIMEKRSQISLTEGLLHTYEALPPDKRDFDYERHLRAKLRSKKNQLTAMGWDGNYAQI